MSSDDTTKVPPQKGPASPSAEPPRDVPTSIRPTVEELAAIDFVVKLNPKFGSRLDALREHSINDCVAMHLNARQLTAAG